MTVKCIKNVFPSEYPECPLWYPDLTIGQIYEVLVIRTDHYRVWGDEGEPYCYPNEAFEIVDAAIPDAWIHKVEEDGATYRGPRELSVPGLFEDYFERKPYARGIIDKYRPRAND